MGGGAFARKGLKFGMLAWRGVAMRERCGFLPALAAWMSCRPRLRDLGWLCCGEQCQAHGEEPFARWRAIAPHEDGRGEGEDGDAGFCPLLQP